MKERASMMGQLSFKKILFNYNLILILVILIIVSAFLSPVFLTAGNMFNLLRQQAPFILITIGMLYVVMTGNIDLAQGSIIALGGVMTVIMMQAFGVGADNAAGSVLVVIIGVAIGALFGLLSGFLVAKLKMISFVATLAVGMVASGIAYMLTNGHPMRIPDDSLSGQALMDFGMGSVPVLGIPWPVVVALGAIILFAWILKYTSFGRLCIATGSNSTAVMLAGQNVQKYKLMTFVISGSLSALAGVIIATRAVVAAPTAGDGYELDAIAGCVIGGASLEGGKGSVLAALAGILVIGLIGNILNLLSVPAFPQKIIKGCIIIAAVLLQMAMEKKERY